MPSVSAQNPIYHTQLNKRQSFPNNKQTRTNLQGVAAADPHEALPCVCEGALVQVHLAAQLLVFLVKVVLILFSHDHLARRDTSTKTTTTTKRRDTTRRATHPLRAGPGARLARLRRCRIDEDGGTLREGRYVVLWLNCKMIISIIC